MAIERLDELNIWRRGDSRAPHKPLLVLLALGKLSRGIQELPYKDCEFELASLLKEFGPTATSFHPEYPFWRLQNDGVWEVLSARPMRARHSNTDPPRSELRLAEARGHLAPDIVAELRAEPALIGKLAQRLLNAHFPESLHGDILDAVGMAQGLERATSAGIPRRDPGFRKAVLSAYEYRCAVCGMDLRIGSMTIGLEAAHIKWHQAHGPDVVRNGLALCVLHHKLFDLGALTVDVQGRVLVSEQVYGAARFDEALMRHHGQAVSAPVRPEHRPGPEFVQWHHQWVFKREARPPGPAANL